MQKVSGLNAANAIVIGGLVAGALDLAAALVFGVAQGTPPVAVLQYIASARIGPGAYEAGLAGALTGVFIHFGASFSFAAAYVVAASRIGALRMRPLVFGPLYGLAVYGTMTFLVVPLSHAAAGSWPPPPFVLISQLFFHLILFGLPIALAASRIRPDSLAPNHTSPTASARGLAFSAPGAILWGGLAAGVLDLAAVLAFWAAHGVAPVAILQSIASSLLGAQAFGGGLGAAALGLFLHFFVSFVFAGAYVAFSAWGLVMRAHPVVFGLLYGLVAAWVMTYAVVPLSRAGFGDAPPSIVNLSASLFIHLVLFGLPIALAASRIRR